MTTDPVVKTGENVVDVPPEKEVVPDEQLSHFLEHKDHSLVPEVVREVLCPRSARRVGPRSVFLESKKAVQSNDYQA